MSADIVTCLQAILAITTTSLIETAEEAQVNVSRPFERKYPEPEDDVTSSEVETQFSRRVVTSSWMLTSGESLKMTGMKTWRRLEGTGEVRQRLTT